MHSSNFSSSNGSTEDLFRDSIDSCDNDITEKVGLGWLEKGLNACLLPGEMGCTQATVWGLGRPCTCLGIGGRWPWSRVPHPPTPHMTVLGYTVVWRSCS